MSKKLKEYFEDGTINDLVQKGFISPSKLSYPTYFESVKVFISKGMKKSDAVLETSIKCKVCESTVWKSIKTIETL